MQEGYWMIRTWQAGNVGEKTKYFLPGARPTGKVRRRDVRAAKKQEQNGYAAQKALARLLNANFGSGDCLLGLDYSEAGMEKILSRGREAGLAVDDEDEAVRMNAIWEAADHEISNCLRRAKRKAKKLGVELKAVYCTSDMDGQTGEQVRVHHHLVINREARAAFELAWKDMGGVDWETLWENQEDLTPVAEYLIRQVRRIPDAKKYHSTRNLIRPEPKDRIAMNDAEMRPPKGARLVYRSEFRPGLPQYIRYIIGHDRR